MLLSLILLASFGCASRATESSSDPPTDVSGQWSGTLIIGPLTPLRCCGANSGFAKIDFQQEGTRVTGLLDAPGLRGSIEARVTGATLSGVLRYRAASTAGDLRIDATVDGNEMLATMLDSKLILSRVH